MAKARERGPTQEEVREWYEQRKARYGETFTSQPSLKQAASLMDRMELAYANRHPKYEISSDADGRWFIAVKRGNGGNFYEAIVSTIHEKCDECGKVIVRRHNNAVPYRAAAKTRYDIKYWAAGTQYKYGPICLGCFNKRRAVYNALVEWEEVRRTIVNVKYKLDKFKKEQNNE